MVVFQDHILGKPLDKEDAGFMLNLLQGKEHDVITGFCVIEPSGLTTHTEYVTSRVKVKDLSKDEINAYIATNEPFGKAGSYAIQGIGSFLIEKISGSYTNIVGLPIYEAIHALLRVGALKHFP